MNAMGIIFANDASIGTLTEKRTMASLPFGGRYRQVDFALSNLTCAGVRHVGIITRHSYQSLLNHVGDGEEWGLEMAEGGLEYLTPYAQTTTDTYRGKLESLNSAMDFLEVGDEDYVVMVDSAIISNIDLDKVVASHVASGKTITVVTKAGICNGEKKIDLAFKLDENGEIIRVVCDYAANPEYLASMDVFVVDKKYLIEAVKGCVARGLYHMDRNLVMGGWNNEQVSINLYQHEGVAMFNESLDEYYKNTLSLVKKDVRDDIFGAAHPVYTKVRDRVPTYYGADSEVEDALIADGCMIDGEVENSVLFRQVTVEEGAEVEKYVILDKEVTVTPGAKLCGTKEHPVVIKKGEIV